MAVAAWAYWNVAFWFLDDEYVLRVRGGARATRGIRNGVVTRLRKWPNCFARNGDSQTTKPAGDEVNPPPGADTNGTGLWRFCRNWTRSKRTTHRPPDSAPPPPPPHVIVWLAVVGQAPEVVYVTVYVPGTDVVKLIVPVEAFANTNPNGDALNVPPNWAMEGEGFAPPKQYAAAEYANVELPAAVKITVCMVDEGQEPPNEYCTKYEPVGSTRG